MSNGTGIQIDNIATDLNGKADVDLVNVNDAGTNKAAGWAMPSATYEDLTLGASGTTYTAPANGWLCISGIRTANYGYLKIFCNNDLETDMLFVSLPNNYTSTSIFPIFKGQFVVEFSDATLLRLRFYYAEGSKEQPPL